MGLPRLIILLALFATGYWLWKKISVPQQAKQKIPGQTSMVRCAHCELYLPQEQAIQHNQHWYCCSDHAHKKN